MTHVSLSSHPLSETSVPAFFPNHWGPVAWPCPDDILTNSPCSYFGFITKHPLLSRFACHVFVSQESMRPVAQSVG